MELDKWVILQVRCLSNGKDLLGGQKYMDTQTPPINNIHVLLQQIPFHLENFPQDLGTWLQGFALIQPKGLRPSSLLVFQFIPKVLGRVELRALGTPVKF